MSFHSSEGTVGIEYELQLVDAESGDLADGIMPILDHFQGNPHVKSEFIQSMIEVITPVCTRMGEVDASLRRTLAELLPACEQLGMRVAAAGTHPFSRRLATVTPLTRYQRMADRSGIIGETQITHALQVHVGVASADEAIVAMRDLRPCLPMFLALSASSPFWFGYDTGFASWRQRVLAADRTYGIPPDFDDWRDVQLFVQAARRGGMMSSWRDIHWDIRPRPDYGTVEIRVMDTLPTVAECATVAAFARALTLYLIRTPASRRPAAVPRRLPSWLERENHFQASRLALDASYAADPAATDLRRLGDSIDAVIDVVAPVAEALGDGPYLAQLQSRVIDDPSHARQRRVYQRTGSTSAVVTALVHELTDDLGGATSAERPRWPGDPCPLPPRR